MAEAWIYANTKRQVKAPNRFGDWETSGSKKRRTGIVQKNHERENDHQCPPEDTSHQQKSKRNKVNIYIQILIMATLYSLYIYKST